MLKVGDKVSVIADKKVREGVIFYENDYYYTVQFPKYKECFHKTDFNNGIVRAQVL